MKELITLLASKVLVPMHTVKPEEFRIIAEEIKNEGGPGIEVILPEYGVEISI